MQQQFSVAACDEIGLDCTFDTSLVLLLQTLSASTTYAEQMDKDAGVCQIGCVS